MWAPGIVGLVVGVLLLFGVRDSPEACGYPPIEEVKPAKKQVEASSAAAGEKPSLLELLLANVLKNPYIWGMALVRRVLFFDVERGRASERARERDDDGKKNSTSPPPPPTETGKKHHPNEQAPNGLPEVFASFPARAASLGIGRCVREAKRRRGPRAVPAFGALADDLTKLIDLYGDWSRRLLPGLPSLAARIDVLEAAGKASALKLELRGVRYNALKVLGEREGEGEEGGEGAQGAAWGEEGETAAAAIVTGHEDDDDEADELLALQAQGGAAAPPTAAAAATTAAAAQRQPEAVAAATAANDEEEEPEFEEEDFDDLLDLVGDDEGSQEEQQQQRGGSGGGEAAGAGATAAAAATEAAAAAPKETAAAVPPAPAAETAAAAEEGEGATAEADDFDELLALVDTQPDA